MPDALMIQIITFSLKSSPINFPSSSAVGALSLAGALVDGKPLEIIVHSMNRDHTTKEFETLGVISNSDRLYLPAFNSLILMCDKVYESAFNPLRILLYHFDKLYGGYA